MPKNNSVISTLFNVLSSSTRRKPKYIRHQALVSHLYPYYIKPDQFNVTNDVFDIKLTQIAKYLNSNDTVGMLNGLFSIELVSQRKDIDNFTDNLDVTNGVFDIEIKTVLRQVNVTDQLNILNGVFDIGLLAVGVYNETTDTITMTNGVFDIELG